MPDRDAIVTVDQITEGLGAFDELEFLGGGTFGDTYRAVRGESETAVKVLHVIGLPDYMWRREIEALSRVDHPNVVGFIDSGSFSAGGTEYQFTQCEYINGGDLEQAVREERRPETAEDARTLLTGLLAGVGEIHELGILHRDVKPGNVALRDADWGQPVLLDFGLARVLDMSSHTELPAHIGTFRYMSPEQLKGGAARRRSDLYAVGLVCYEVTTGRHPFIPRGEAATLQALFERMRDEQPLDPRELNDACPADVAAVLLRLLEFQPHKRLGVTAAFRDLEGPDGTN